jgi:hypothetical protein
MHQPYITTYTCLRVNALTPEWHERTCNYWYTVTCSPAMSHTAFTTKEEFYNWLGERGLQLHGSLPVERGTYASLDIIGSYRVASYIDGDVASFLAIQPIIKIAVMSNSNYTLGKVTEDEHRVRTIHHLNPNVRARIVFPRHQASEFPELVKNSPDILATSREHPEDPFQ